MFSAINIIISMDIDDDMMDDAVAVSQNSTIGCFEYFLNAWLVVFGIYIPKSMTQQSAKGS
jgi:hypothetical protein